MDVIHSVLNAYLHMREERGRYSALIFSDCAFLTNDDSLSGALSARYLMERFLMMRLPVRIGMAKGTFTTMRFASDVTNEATVTRAIFSGTAVVWSHNAEKSGGKGLRIFLHPSIGDDLDSISTRCRVLPLGRATRHAAWELDYLWEGNPEGEWVPRAEDSDAAMRQAVLEMLPEGAPPDVRVHYDETLAAINRMRAAAGRSEFE